MNWRQSASDGNFRLSGSRGFGLVELLMLIVIIGILAAVAMSSLETAIDSHRRSVSEREMQTLINGIAGNADRLSGGVRSDFGFVGDVGTFPSSLDQLQHNPGYSSWHGPYLPQKLLQDTVRFLKDEWGKPYQYDGSLTVNSVGSGSTLTAKLPGSPPDYLLNRVRGVVSDGDGNYPGVTYTDSVTLALTVPDGMGGYASRTTHPLWNGSFEFDSLPIGRHALVVVFEPTLDTLHRMVTILPRQRNDSPLQFRFAAAVFGPSGPATSAVTLRPDGSGSTTELTTEGCSANYLCVNEAIPDDDVTRLGRSSATFAEDLYSIDDPGAMSGNISTVILFGRARPEPTQGDIKMVLKTHGSRYEGASQPLSTGWLDLSSSWDLNPATGGAWSWQEIADLEAGPALRGQNAAHPAYCTQFWIVVEYTP